MLALITQSRTPRPWMQLGTAAAFRVPLKSLMLEAPQQQVADVGKRRSSRIPRMIRTPTKEQKDKEEAGSSGGSVAAAGAGAGAGAGTGVASVPPVVRSTRTSRCRMLLAHPDSLSTPKATPSPRLREPSRPLMRRKSLTEPLLQISRSLINLCDPLKQCVEHLQMLRFECSDRRLINVPCQLINRYSPLMCERQRAPLFNYQQVIQLETVKSTTLLRLIRWMQHHRIDDLNLLHRTPPTVTPAGSLPSTWDERFLGFDTDAVHQLLLAASCLGINPLVEHAMLYFIELIQQRQDSSCQSEATIVGGTDCSLN